MSRIKKLELWVLVLWNIPAFILSYYYGSNYIITALLFFGVPAAYISVKRENLIKKITTVSLVMSIPAVTVIDYLAFKDGSWYNPSTVGIHFFGAYPVDDFLWAFLCFYYVIGVYEYFFERERILKVSKKFIGFEKVGLIASVLFSAFLYFSGDVVIIPFFYIKMIGIILLFIPMIIFLAHPKIFAKALYTGLLFVPLFILYEYVANIKENWFFPGTNFIGYVQFLNVSIPLEELLWLLFFAPAVVAIYEFLADDDR